MLPITYYIIIVAFQAAVTYCCMQFTPSQHLKRRRKAYRTKNVPCWKAKPDQEIIIAMQKSMLKTYLCTRWRLNDEETSSEKSSQEIDTGRKNVALNATNKKTYKVKRFHFDSDSYKVAIDLGALYCISHSPRDFEGAIKRTSDSVVDGIAAGLDHPFESYPHSTGRKKQTIIRRPLMAYRAAYLKKTWYCIGTSNVTLNEWRTIACRTYPLWAPTAEQNDTAPS